jgi:hypothetical protein
MEASEEKLFILDLLKLNKSERMYSEETVINIIKQVLKLNAFQSTGVTRENVKSIIHWTHNALLNGKITGSDNEIANNCMKELSIASSSAPEEKIGDEDIERWVCSGICDEFKSIFMDGAVFGVKAYRDGTISEWVKNN